MTLRKPEDIDHDPSTDTVESAVNDSDGPQTVTLDGQQHSMTDAIERLHDDLTAAHDRITHLERVNAELREAIEYLGELHDKEIEIEA